MELLVTAEWLAERLGEPGVVVLDATLPPVGVVPVPDVQGRFRERHIPGAQYFDIEALSDASSGLPHTFPTAQAFAAGMAALGVAESMTIVVYEQAGVFSAPRAWWMLRTFGARDVRVLDGGLEAWVAAGLPVVSKVAPVQPVEFHAVLDTGAVRGFDHVQRLIAGHGQILDARPAGRFAGTAPEPRAGLPSGHMPGATSVPLQSLVRDGRLKPVEELREQFEALGVDLERPVTTTCGSGVTAAGVALGLALAGAREVSLYDGSWAEYASRPEAVIATDG